MNPFKFIDAELAPRLQLMPKPFTAKQLIAGTKVKQAAPWPALVGQWLHRQGYFYRHTRLGNVWSKPTSDTRP